MSGLLLAIGGVAAVCSAGTGLAAALKWFHSYEPEFSNKPKSQRGGIHRDKLDNLSKRINSRSDLR